VCCPDQPAGYPCPGAEARQFRRFPVERRVSATFVTSPRRAFGARARTALSPCTDLALDARALGSHLHRAFPTGSGVAANLHTAEFTAAHTELLARRYVATDLHAAEPFAVRHHGAGIAAELLATDLHATEHLPVQPSHARLTAEFLAADLHAIDRCPADAGLAFDLLAVGPGPVAADAGQPPGLLAPRGITVAPRCRSGSPPDRRLGARRQQP
jgi:hypothetical protein